VRDYRISGGDLSDEQRQVLNEAGDLLVIGRPGSGKTSIALIKALKFLDEAADERAQALFLSFSKAAVYRIRAASRFIIPRSAAGRLQVTTFHGFCFGVLNSHARLVGLPRLGAVVLPHEQKIIEAEHGGTKDGLSALERSEGRVSFERFVPLTLALFKKHAALRAAYAAAYPLVIVDEYQDTNDDQDELIDLLATPGQVTYLGDPDQRVYDFIAAVREDRFERLVARRGPRRIDLPVKSHRSGASDLVGYGRAVLAGRALTSRPRDVEVFRYGRKADFSKKLRVAIVSAEEAVRTRSGGKVTRPSTAVLTFTNAFAMRLSEGLRSAVPGFDDPFEHALNVDMPDIVPAWSLALAILECPGDADAGPVLADALHEFARFEASQETLGRQRRALTLRESAEAFRRGAGLRALAEGPAFAGGRVRPFAVGRSPHGHFTRARDPGRDRRQLLRRCGQDASPAITGELSAAPGSARRIIR
jgi:DNA helicase-2/ATP-dependent DNA helicase PcrA